VLWECAAVGKIPIHARIRHLDKKADTYFLLPHAVFWHALPDFVSSRHVSAALTSGMLLAFQFFNDQIDSAAMHKQSVNKGGI
jgi:hypothetical protein